MARHWLICHLEADRGRGKAGQGGEQRKSQAAASLLPGKPQLGPLLGKSVVEGDLNPCPPLSLNVLAPPLLKRGGELGFQPIPSASACQPGWCLAMILASPLK